MVEKDSIDQDLPYLGGSKGPFVECRWPSVDHRGGEKP